MGQILTRLLSNGGQILSETTRGVTTTQVLNRDGEVILTRLKSITKKQVPPKVRRVGFLQQSQNTQKTFVTIKKALEAKSEGIKEYSILDRVYQDGTRLGERRLTSTSPKFDRNSKRYNKNIYVNENGYMINRSSTSYRNGVRDQRHKYSEDFELIKEKDKLLEKESMLIKKGTTLSKFVGYHKTLNLINHMLYSLQEKLKSINNEIFKNRSHTKYNCDGLPENFGHLTEHGLNLNF